MAELKPCPFCGNVSPEIRYDFKNRTYHVLCTQCDATGGDRSNRSYAEIIWNKRYGE